MAEVTGQAAAAESLRRALANDEVGHAFLFVGPEGVGQRGLVRLLAAGLNCSDLDHGRPCGTCDSCARVQRGTHGAVVRFEPVGADYLVDEVRDDWGPVASRTVADGHRRVIHIVAADRMNEATQNAFLKFLEEPPPSTVWVLDAQSTAPLLDTIISRCRRLDLRAWSSVDLRTRAQALGVDDPERARVLARAAQGSPTRLAEFVHDLWEWTCPDCKQVTRFHGVVQAAWPTQCENSKCASVKTGESATLVQTRVDQSARRRHHHVIARFRADEPNAVSVVAGEVEEWAKARSEAVERDHEQERDDLVRAAGLAPDRDTRTAWRRAFRDDLEPSVRNPVRDRQKRELRQATLAGVTSFLDDFGSYLRDLVAVASGAELDDLVNLDAHDLLVADAAVVPVEVGLGALAQLPSTREALVVHSAQPRLQLERLLMPIYVAVYKATH